MGCEQSKITEDKAFWTKRAVWLCWFTIIYNLLEGLISVGLGIKDEAVSLAGFGIDSFIEVASAVIVLWKFKSEASSDTVISVESERSATHAIGWLFLSLAVITFSASSFRLWTKGAPDTTVPGLFISTLSISFMFFLWKAKIKAGKMLDSATVMKDAACSRACIQLSFVLLCGSLIYIIFPGLWWADSVVAMLIGGLIAREGWETVKAAKSEHFTGGCGCD
jgi:Co/Zn/Cd efflux system component